MYRKFKPIVCAVVAIIMLFPIHAFAQGTAGSQSDLAGHWAENQMAKWRDQGLVQGYGDGSFKPNKPITRAEFVVFVNRIFQFSALGDVSFSDIDARSPFYSDIQKAVTAGYIQGYEDGTFRPDKPINRQEAAVIVAKAFLVEPSAEAADKLSDVEALAQWSKEAVRALVQLGYVNGYPDGTFKANNLITRAEAVTLLGNIAGEVINKPGNHSGLTVRNMIISASGVVLQDTFINGNLIVTESALQSGLTLNNVTVTGTLYVIGGSERNLSLVNSAIGKTVYVNGPTAPATPAPTANVTPAPTNNVTPTPMPTPTAPLFSEVSVHDPSIIKDGNTYYVFGSHIDAAKSTDLMNWSRFTNGYTTPGNAIYGDLSANLAGSFAWAGENDADSSGGFSVWAPDIKWFPDFENEDGSKGVYLMYYSVSSTYIRSAIGIAASKHIEGPYEYVDTIIYSGFTREDATDSKSTINKKWTNTHLPALIDDGQVSEMSGNWFNSNGSYRNSEYPNAIDANLFYDSDGKLWMSYGSWSGGIFLLELDETTGLPIYPGNDGTTEDGRLIDRYFGIKIAGGYGKSGEGPYIVYDQSNGYYYLYVTYGWLGADGEYNMRVFRATEPEGPYVDGLEQNAVLPASVDNAPYGNRLMGHHLFERMIGDPGTGIGTGYVSPGHNSVLLDDETGQQFVVFHARFPQRGEAHELRIHQLFMNEDGWPVAAPYRYSGETLEQVAAPQLIGEYKYINHGKDNSKTIKKSQFIRLNDDFTVAGDVTGSWQLKNDNIAEITINGQVYNGVFVTQWDTTSQMQVMTFTAMSSEGQAIWGSKLLNRTDAEIAQDVLDDIQLGDLSAVVADLSLPAEGTRHSSIVWSTSDAAVVTDDGIVTRPEVGEQPASVILTATVTKGAISASKSFIITVLPVQGAYLKSHYTFDGDMTDSFGSFGAGTVTGDRIDNTGGTITYGEGKEGSGAIFDGASGIRLADGLITGNNYSVALWVKPDQLTSFTTTFFGARDGTHWISLLPQGPAGNNTMLWSGSEVWYDAPANLTISTNEWSHLAFSVEQGSVKVYVNAVERFAASGFPDIFTTDNGIFGLGVNWWDSPFKGMIDDLRIYDGVLSQQQISSMVFDSDTLVEEIGFAFTEKRVSVGNSFTPVSFTISPGNAGNPSLAWQSSNASVATVHPQSGKVTGVAAGSATITAAATDGSGISASYTVHVLDGPIAHFAFDGDLQDETGLAAGTVTGNRINNSGGTITFDEGKAGQAAVFDGTSGIRLSDGLIAGNKYTVTMSVYLEQPSQFTTTFFGARTPDSWISFLPRGHGDTYQESKLWSGTAWYDAPVGMEIPVRSWTDIAFAVNNGTVTLYINGVAAFTDSGFPNIFTSDNAVFGLGVNYWDVPFNGRIDDLRIYDTALTSQQIQQLHQ